MLNRRIEGFENSLGRRKGPNLPYGLALQNVLVEITGLAWSGRGRIERVEVSTDNGQTWQEAEIQEPRYTKAFTRFRLPWRWDGAETVLQSRCTDDTGYVQPANEALIAARGMNSDYHNNAIKSWKIGADGSVENVNA
jgi:sulfane dehydrogenase subunit SoxC